MPNVPKELESAGISDHIPIPGMKLSKVDTILSGNGLEHHVTLINNINNHLPPFKNFANRPTVIIST